MNAPHLKSFDWPLLRSLRGANPAGLGRDVLAGLTLAAIAIPGQMATARLGGFAPQIGFFAFVAASVGFALFGAGRQVVVGADTTITPIFAGSLAALAAVGSAQYASLAAMLAIMVGVVLVLAGAFRLGWIADLLSAPVVTGFLAGIALHIILSQAPSILGLPEGSGSVYQRLAMLGAQVGQINGVSAAIGLGVLGVIFAAQWLSPRIPGALIAVAGASLLAALLGPGRHGVAMLGEVQGGFPHFSLPSFAPEHAVPMLGLAFVVALMVMVQAAATSRSLAAPGEAPDIDRDFIGLGAASALAGLVGAFPVNASPPLSNIVAASGGRTQVASLTAALAVLLVAAFGARLLAQIPTAALGGVLLFVALRIFRLKSFAELLRRTPAEFALALLTTVLIVALPIQTGVAVGVFLSLVHGVFTITRVRPIAFERVPQTTVWWPALPGHAGERAPGVLVMGFQAPLSFLNAEEFRRGMLAVIEAGKGSARLLVLEASSIVEIDFTAAVALAQVIEAAHADGIDFAVSRLESVRGQAAFDRFGLTGQLGADHLFHSVEEAIRALGGGIAPPPA